MKKTESKKSKKNLIKSKLLRRIICIALCLCIAGALFIGLANAYVVGYASKYILDLDAVKNETFDCVMVLGARKGSPMLDERIEFGLEAYKTGCTD